MLCLVYDLLNILSFALIFLGAANHILHCVCVRAHVCMRIYSNVYCNGTELELRTVNWSHAKHFVGSVIIELFLKLFVISINKM